MSEWMQSGPPRAYVPPQTTGRVASATGIVGLISQKSQRREGMKWVQLLPGAAGGVDAYSETDEHISMVTATTPVRFSQAVTVPWHGAPYQHGDQALRYYTEGEISWARFMAARSRTPLMRHQLEAVVFLAHHERERYAPRGGFFCDAPRLGKTLTLLTHILESAQRRVGSGGYRFGHPTLYVAPNSTLTTAVAQLQRHFGPGESPLVWRVVTNNPETQRQPLEKHDVLTCDVIFTTYSALVSACATDSVSVARTFYDVQWERLVCDEAHVMGHAAASQYGAADAIDACIRWFVTGTPIQNSIVDVETALRFVGVAAPACPDGRDSPAYVTAVRESFRPRLLYRTALDVVDTSRLGGTLVHVDYTTMQSVYLDFQSAAERALYDHLYTLEQRRQASHADGKRARAGSAVDTMLSDDSVRGTFYVLRLRQLCLSPVIVPAADLTLPPGMRMATAKRDSPEFEQFVVHALIGPLDTPAVVFRNAHRVLPPISTKEAAVIDYYRRHVEPAGERLIVFSNFVKCVERLAFLFDRRAVLMGRASHVICVTGQTPDRDQLLARAMTDATVTCLFMTIGTGGLGTDLSEANHVLLPDPWWNPQVESQAVARVGGINQRRVVRATRLVMRNTIEERVVELADRKWALYEYVMARSTVPNGNVRDEVSDAMEVDDNDT